MAVDNTDLTLYASTAASSTGGAISGSGITSAVMNNLFANVLEAERIAGIVRHYKTFFKNEDLISDASDPVIYCPALAAPATYEIGLGANNSADDDPTQGNMSTWTASAKVALVSDGADVRQATIRGMNAAGSAPQTETVTLTGASEVLSVADFTGVVAITLSATSGTRTVLIKQGSGGTTRGTIGPNKIQCWLWKVAGTAKANGIAITDLLAGQVQGVWHRMTVAAGAPATRPVLPSITIEEN